MKVTMIVNPKLLLLPDRQITVMHYCYEKVVEYCS